MDPAAQYAMAYALTTSAGIRALLPLALFSIAAHFGYVHPPQPFTWLGSMPVTIVLVAVAVVELLADKVPLLDHALHVVQIAVKPAAAAVLVAGTAHPQNPDVLVGLMILGALNALGVHAISASMRVGSTATTAGMANPVLSTGEDAAAFSMTALAFFAPFAAAALALLAGVALFFLVRAFVRRPGRAVR